VKANVRAIGIGPRPYRPQQGKRGLPRNRPARSGSGRDSGLEAQTPLCSLSRKTETELLQSVEVYVVLRCLKLPTEPVSPCARFINSDIPESMEIARQLDAGFIQRDYASAAELPHEVTQFEDHVLTRSIGILRNLRTVWANSSVVGREDDDGEAHFDCVGLELLD